MRVGIEALEGRWGKVVLGRISPTKRARGDLSPPIPDCRAVSFRVPECRGGGGGPGRRERGSWRDPPRGQCSSFSATVAERHGREGIIHIVPSDCGD